MTYIKIVVVVFLAIATMFVTSLLYRSEPEYMDVGEVLYHSNLPPSTKMYFSILHYANEYNIPTEYAFAIAYAETGYRGPFHWGYNHARVSHANAMGPMQIMPKTANWLTNKNIKHDELMTNIPLNVELSMKLLNKMKKRYKDWKVVFGYYNTGRPIINDYAMRVYNKEYVWDKATK